MTLKIVATFNINFKWDNLEQSPLYHAANIKTLQATPRGENKKLVEQKHDTAKTF